jgi:hypothetical protein
VEPHRIGNVEAPMILFLLGLMQSVATAPDIELHANIQAQSVRIEKEGRATLKVYGSPDAGSVVKIEGPRADGAKTLRNVRITVDAEARIGSHAAEDGTEKLDQPQPNP